MGIYTFRIRGTLCHQIGSLIPPDGQQPKFAQIYVVDSDINEQIKHQLKYGHGHIDETILRDLLTMMQQHNPYYEMYKIAKKRMGKDVNLQLNLTTWDAKKHDPRRYNLPTTSEVGIIIKKDFSNANSTRDLIIEHCSGKLQRISELHSAYLPLRFPLLFPYGEQGWHPAIPFAAHNPHADNLDEYENSDNELTHDNVTKGMF